MEKMALVETNENYPKKICITGFQDIARYVGNGNDESVCGQLHLYEPASQLL